MAKVIVMPGVAFHPTDNERVDPNSCLNSAMDAGLADVVIIGRTISGEVEVWSSQPDADAVMGLTMRAIAVLSTAEQVRED